MKDLEELIRKEYDNATNKYDFINALRSYISALSNERNNPVDLVLWVDKNEVVANNYNPNSVAPKEMELLYTSIKEDGYTQPIVVYRDEALGKFVIVDGFHRNLVLRKYADINERCNGRLPVVVIKKDLDQRMASTVRHNRARGSHSVDGMINIVHRMMKDGKSEKEICEKLGMSRTEFVKMGYVTGFAKVFKNYDFSKSIDFFVADENLKKELEDR